MKRCGVLTTLVCILLIGAATCSAVTVNVPTNQGTGQDGMIYANPGVPFPLSSFYSIIAVGATGGPHDTVALTMFDLSTVGLTSAQVSSATLTVYSASSKAVNATNLDPDANNPVTVDISAVTSAWNRASMTWATQPTHGPVETSFSVNALSQPFVVDITTLVKGWLDSPASNFGLWLSGHSIQGSGPNQDVSPFYAVAFNSGFQANTGQPNANGPLLTINAVPEPATWLLMACAVPALAWARRRNLRSKN